MPATFRRRERPRVALITPYGAQANNGNWHTAARWARMLAPHARVHLATQWSAAQGPPADLMIALHARRSAATIDAFARACPQQPLIVVLTGTDLYRDIHVDAAARRSLELASLLVVLQEAGLAALPAGVRAKARCIPQSAPQLARLAPRVRTFDVAVVGHLRDEKDPLTAMRAAERLPADSRIRLLHAGDALTPALGAAARRTERACAQYTWLGGLPAPRARALIRRSRLLLHPSKMEGGSQVIIEAVRCGVPVIASRCDGHVGLLGRDHPGFFPVGDDAACARLLQRAERDPAFLLRLLQAGRRRAPLFAPAREAAALRGLLRTRSGG
jgi:putative glycosyltransferase (TIGR04348 family)